MSTQPKDNNRPSLRISIPSSFLPQKKTCEDQIATMSTLLHGDKPSSLTNSAGISGNNPPKKARVQFSSKIEVVPSSPNLNARGMYDSNEPEETPSNRSDRSHDTMSSLLNSYLSLDANAAHRNSSNHSSGDECGRDGSEHPDGSFSVADSERDILDRLFASHLPASHLHAEVRK